MLIEKAQESLQAAELCYNAKLYNSTLNRAYFAMFQAAVVALEGIGVQPKGGEWSHEKLQATFARRLIHEKKLLPQRFARYLPDAMDLRHKADYRKQHISANEASHIMRRAREFLQLLQSQIGYGT